jgi:hypothetical protein
VDPNFPHYIDLDGDPLEETGLSLPKNLQFPDTRPIVIQKKSNNVSTIQLGMKPLKKEHVRLAQKRMEALNAEIQSVRSLK